jgi:hypothetical protein
MKKQLMPMVLFAITLTALVFFAGCKGVYTGDENGFDSDWREGEIAGGGGDANGTFAGSITFSDGLPTVTTGEVWAIYVTPDTVSSFQNGATAMSHYVAGGASTSVNGNKVNLIITGATGGTFNKNGSYTVIFYSTSDLYNLKYKSSVKFSGGNATISYSSMSTVSAWSM